MAECHALNDIRTAFTPEAALEESLKELLSENKEPEEPEQEV
jgi:hypothetical protein